MNKTDLLFQMLQQPQAYSEAEWQKILADGECRELYFLMSKTRSAIDAARSADKITNEMVDAEWQRLNAEHSLQLTFFNSQFRKIAALFAGIIILSGIAYAAIQWYAFSYPSEEDKKIVATGDTVRAGTQSLQDFTEGPVVFDNVSLQKMLPEIAACYGVKVIFKDDVARQVRLFFQWRPQEPMEKVVRKLNHFESIHLRLENDTLFVSSTLTPQ